LANVDEIPDILRLPRPLQEKFFTVVAEEVESLRKRVDELSRNLGPVLRMLRNGISKFEVDEGWRETRYVVVDGSDVPVIDERIGLRYGLYAVAYKIFKGIEAVDGGEGYFGDRLSGNIGDIRESFLKLLDLLTTYYERLTENQFLKRKDIELVFVDGSFFGYRAGCSMIKFEPLGFTDPLTGEKFHNVIDLIKRINELTMNLLESKKAVAVIKRVPTTALDGYISYLQGFDKAVNLSDRSILSFLMERGEVFDYEDVFKSIRYDVFSWFTRTAKDESLRRKGRMAVLSKAERRVKVQLIADLTDWDRGSSKEWRRYEEEPIIKAVRSTRRMFLRTVADIPPICIEVPSDMPQNLLNKALSIFFATANPATGLPLSLDIVDDLVSLPRGIGKEFVNEIEAELLRKGLTREYLMALFSRYNPQKDEP